MVLMSPVSPVLLKKTVSFGLKTNSKWELKQKKLTFWSQKSGVWPPKKGFCKQGHLTCAGVKRFIKMTPGFGKGGGFKN